MANESRADALISGRQAVTVARLTRWMGPYATLLQMLVLGLLALSISRIGLLLWQWDRVEATGILGRILVQGVRADLILLGYLLAIPLVLAPLFAHQKPPRFGNCLQPFGRQSPWFL